MRISTLSGAASGGPRGRFRTTRAVLQCTVSALTLGVMAAFLLVQSPRAFAGESDGGGAAEREVARRQQQIENAFRLVTEGDKLRADNDLPGAMLNYRSAYTGMQPSVMSDEARAMALDRFSKASVEYAQSLIAGARYDEAATILDAILEPDFAPDDAPALKLRKQLRDPDYYNLALSPAHLEKVERVEKLLKDGQGLIELADFDGAEARYDDALRIDPTNTSARRGLEETETQRIAYQRSARDHTRATMLRGVDEAWESTVPLDDLNILAASDSSVLSGISSDNASAEIEKLLADTTLSVINFDDTSLAEAVEFLTAKSKESDPLGRGVNIVLALAEEDTLARNARLNLILRNVPLSEVLRYITRDTGTKYKIDRFAVSIVSEGAASTQLLTRTYTVPPGFLNTAPGGDSGAADDPFGDAGAAAGGTNLKSNSATAKDFLTSSGISFPEGASAFYNAASSTLTVRNSQTNLDTIEEMISSTLRAGPRQVVITIKMFEIKESRAKELGIETLIGQFNVDGSERIFGGGGTQGNTLPPYGGPTVRSDFPFVTPGTSAPLGNNPVTAGNRSGTIAQPMDSIDARLTNAATTSVSTRAPGILSVAGPFTDPQFQMILRAIDQKTGVDVMTSPSTVAKSGQRATIQVNQEFIYPTEYDPPEIPQDFGSFQTAVIDPVTGFVIDPVTGLPTLAPFMATNSSPSIPVTPAHPTAFEMRPVGTKLEVEPVIGPDGFLVDLNIAIELVRFEGFINYGTPITTGTQVLTENEILMPVFNVIKEATAPQAYDGATLLIGGLVTDRLDETNDRTPFLGDIPVLGRLFKTRTSTHERKVIMIFVSTRIIDPAGRPVNATARR
jgi:general secretion pathway protein D